MEDVLDIIIHRRNPLLDHNLVRNVILQNIFEEQANDPPVYRPVFNLNDFSPREAKLNFRFHKEDLPRLCQALRIPNNIITLSGHQASGIEGLCLLLRRLAYPNRLCDLEEVFQRSSSALSEIINAVNRYIFNEFRHLLEDLRNLHWLNEEKLQQYAQAVSDKGGALQNCWGFIDGTIRPICRPSEFQENYYSGHKRVHCVKYQALVAPDGLTVSAIGAFEGRRHDAGIFRESGLYEQLEEKTKFANGNTYVIFGDQAYGIRELLICPYPGHGINAEQQNFNASMSVVRTSVEWSFSKINAEFAFIDFKKNQKLLLQDVEQMYKTATNNKLS